MKKLLLKTQRLIIKPADEAELKTMFSGSAENIWAGSTDGWDTPWRITLKDSPDKYIGYVGFLGGPKDGCVRIICMITPEHRDNGYSTEAMRKMIGWAFSHKEVAGIITQVPYENEIAKRLLKRLKFKPVTGEEGTDPDETGFLLERPDSNKGFLLTLVFTLIGMVTEFILQKETLFLVVLFLAGEIAGHIVTYREREKNRKIIHFFLTTNL